MKIFDVLIVKWVAGKIKSDRDLEREVCKALNTPHTSSEEVVGW